MIQHASLVISAVFCYSTVVAQRDNRPARRAVLLTTDCGADMDDQWTIAQLALAPELELRGVVTTHAPNLPTPAAETTARLTREVLEQLPLKGHPPVFAGSSVPLETRTLPYRNQGVDFIIQQSKSFSPQHRLAVLITGAATDVASALLIDHTLGNRIEIIAVGFDKWPQGGDSWNVKNDIRAWQVVLESGLPVTIGDAAVTLRSLALTRLRARQLVAGRGPAGKYLADLHTAWIEHDPAFCQKVTGQADTWPIWDQVTLAYLLGFTKSRTYPRPTLNDDLRFAQPISGKANATVRWITAIDSTRLWKHLTTNLDRANKP